MHEIAFSKFYMDEDDAFMALDTHNSHYVDFCSPLPLEDDDSKEFIQSFCSAIKADVNFISDYAEITIDKEAALSYINQRKNELLKAVKETQTLLEKELEAKSPINLETFTDILYHINSSFHDCYFIEGDEDVWEFSDYIIYQFTKTKANQIKIKIESAFDIHF